MKKRFFVSILMVLLFGTVALAQTGEWQFSKVLWNGGVSGVAVTPNDYIWVNPSVSGGNTIPPDSDGPYNATDLVALRSDGTVRQFWRGSISAPGPGGGISVGPDGRVYASYNGSTGTYGGPARVYRITSTEPPTYQSTYSVGSNYNVSTAVADANGNIIVAWNSRTYGVERFTSAGSGGTSTTNAIPYNSANLPNITKDIAISADGKDLYIACSDGTGMTTPGVAHWRNNDATPISTTSTTYTFQKIIGSYGSTDAEQVHVDQYGNLWVGYNGAAGRAARFDCWENPGSTSPTIVATITSPVMGASVTSTQFNSGAFAQPRGFWLSNDGKKAYIGDFNQGILEYNWVNTSGTYTLTVNVNAIGGPFTSSATVTVTENGGSALPPQTISTGVATFTVGAGKTYTVTATTPQSGWSISPASFTVGPISANCSVNFNAIQGAGPGYQPPPPVSTNSMWKFTKLLYSGIVMGVAVSSNDLIWINPAGTGGLGTATTGYTGQGLLALNSDGTLKTAFTGTDYGAPSGALGRGMSVGHDGKVYATKTNNICIVDPIPTVPTASLPSINPYGGSATTAVADAWGNIVVANVTTRTNPVLAFDKDKNSLGTKIAANTNLPNNSRDLAISPDGKNLYINNIDAGVAPVGHWYSATGVHGTYTFQGNLGISGYPGVTVDGIHLDQYGRLWVERGSTASVNSVIECWDISTNPPTMVDAITSPTNAVQNNVGGFAQPRSFWLSNDGQKAYIGEWTGAGGVLEYTKVTAYKISGTISPGISTPITINLIDNSNNQIVQTISIAANATSYQFTAEANKTYRVEPSSDGYTTFTPSSITVTNLSADVTNQNFTTSSTSISSKWKFNRVIYSGQVHGVGVTANNNIWLNLYHVNDLLVLNQNLSEVARLTGLGNENTSDASYTKRGRGLSVGHDGKIYTTYNTRAYRINPTGLNIEQTYTISGTGINYGTTPVVSNAGDGNILIAFSNHASGTNVTRNYGVERYNTAGTGGTSGTMAVTTANAGMPILARDLAISSNGQYLYVACTDGTGMTVPEGVTEWTGNSNSGNYTRVRTIGNYGTSGAEEVHIDAQGKLWIGYNGAAGRAARFDCWDLSTSPPTIVDVITSPVVGATVTSQQFNAGAFSMPRGFWFSPDGKRAYIGDFNQGVLEYMIGYTISGTISPAVSAPVVITLIDNSNNQTVKTVTLAANATSYSILAEEGKTYRVQLSASDGYSTFTPPSQTLGGPLTADVSGINFTSQPINIQSTWEFSRVIYSGQVNGVGVTADNSIWLNLNTQELLVLNQNLSTKETYSGLGNSSTAFPTVTGRGLSVGPDGKVYATYNGRSYRINPTNMLNEQEYSISTGGGAVGTTPVANNNGDILVGFTNFRPNGVERYSSTGGGLTDAITGPNNTLPTAAKDLALSLDGQYLYIANTTGGTSVQEWFNAGGVASGTYTFRRYIGNYGDGAEEVHIDAEGKLWVGYNGVSGRAARFDCWNVSTDPPTIVDIINSPVTGATVTPQQFSSGGFSTPRGLWFSPDGQKAYIGDFNRGVLEYSKGSILTISGTVTGLTTNTETVTITISPDPATGPNTQTIRNNQQYSFNVLSLQDYTVSVATDDYTFAPLYYHYTNLSEDKVNQDFVASAPHSYTISGDMRLSTSNGSLITENILIRLTDINNSTDIRETILSNGSYSITVEAGKTYRVEPRALSDYGYTLKTPPTGYYTVGPITRNVRDVNFVVDLNQYTIDGYVYDANQVMDDVVVNIFYTINGISYKDSVVTGSGSLLAGQYKFANLYSAQTYTVVVSTTTGDGRGLTFFPAQKQFYLTNNRLHEDFLTFSNPENTAEINGYIATDLTNLTTGVNNIGILISSINPAFPFSTTILTGTQTNSTNKGYYSFRLPLGYRYTITPLTQTTNPAVPDQGYTYQTPSGVATITTPELTSDGLPNQNFRAILKQYTISGKVWDGTNPLDGATVTITKDGGTTPLNTIITGADGLYAFNNIDAHSNYLITVSKGGFIFVNSTKEFLDLVGNKPGEDFQTTLNSVKISGYVRTGTNVGVPHIIVTITNINSKSSVSAVTQTDGSYEVYVPISQSYTVYPSTNVDQGYTFNPSQRTLNGLLINAENQNFTATLKSYTISGYVFTANGTPIGDVQMACSGQPNGRTNSEGFYSFTVLAFGTYLVSPVSSGSSFLPAFVQFENLIGNKTQDFKQTTERGLIYTDPPTLEFDNVFLGKTITKELLIGNNGTREMNVTRVRVTGPDEASFTHNVTDLILIGVNSTRTIGVSFTANSLDTKNAFLEIYHEGEGLNPLVVPLFGNGTRTLATLGPFEIVDFGQVAINSGIREYTIQIDNTSPYEEDILTLSNAYFETIPSLFGVYGPYHFPSGSLQLGGINSVPITITFSPTELGDQADTLHIINSSANMPDAQIRVIATVYQGYLEVTPSAIDYGVLDDVPSNDETVTIRNISTNPINITEMYISDDDGSFVLFDAEPILLQAQQTTTVTVRFQPVSIGRKTGVFNIINDYQLTPHMQVPLTGTAIFGPKIYTEIQSIDFGTMHRGTTKDTVLVVQNIGSTPLNISASTFLGPNADMFKIVSPASGTIIIPGWETGDITIRATALLPNEAKSAQLQLTTNDHDNGRYIINLLTTVTSSVLVRSFDGIMFDSLAVGYCQDTVLVFKNEGDKVCEVSTFEIIGPFSSDFSIDVSARFSLAPGETKLVNIKFTPLATGLRYAVISMIVNDPVEPNQNIRLQGWAVEALTLIPDISIGGEPKDEWDFGVVVVRETATQELGISNLAKHGTLRIDKMEMDFIEKQPFSYGDLKFPLYINPGQTLPITLSFTPNDIARSYKAFLTIQYSDSVAAPNPDNTVKVFLQGSVIFPGIEYLEVPRVLEFLAPVMQGQRAVKNFGIMNKSTTYLTVDSIVVVGEDASEFIININKNEFPIRIEFDSTRMVGVTFFAGRIGAKDAKILVYNTDLISAGPSGANEIQISAECILGNDNTSSVTMLDEIPTAYNLSQNYPNPFNPTTKIEYSLIEASRVRLSVYNSLGQEVMNLVDNHQAAGKYLVDFNATNLPSGIYFYRLQSEKFTAVKKMMLVK